MSKRTSVQWLLSHPSFFGGIKFKLDDHERTQWGVIVGALGTSKHLRNKSFTQPFFTSGFCWQPRGSNLGPFVPKAELLLARLCRKDKAREKIKELQYYCTCYTFANLK